VGVTQHATGVSQRVVDELAIAARAREAGGAQQAQVMVDQVLRAAG
jgi:hypothetical protein